MSPSLSWFERDALSSLLEQVGLPERRAAAPRPAARMTAPGAAGLDMEGSYEVTVENRFRPMAKIDAGRFANSASTQPGPMPPGRVDDAFDKKATRLAAGQPAPPLSFPQGGAPPGKAPNTEDGPPPERRKRHSEWGGAAAVHRAHANETDPLNPPEKGAPRKGPPRLRGKKGGTITAPPSSSDPLDGDFPDSSDIASSRPEQVPPFVAPLGPVELRLEALLQWCVGLGPVAGELRGAAIADQEGLPLAVKLLHEEEKPREPWFGGALEVALGYLESDGAIREGQLRLVRESGPLTVVWVPAVLGQRWYLIVWGDEAPRDEALHAIVDAFRELCRRARLEAEAS